MTHPFGNDRYRFGSARLASRAEIEAAGMFEPGAHGFYCGLFEGRPLFYRGDGGIVIIAPARGGKLRDGLAQNVCSGTGIMARTTKIIFDPKGELAFITQDQTRDQENSPRHCIYFNPYGLHGLPRHRLNPLSHLKWGSKTLFADAKFAAAGLLPNTGAPQARYFESNARRLLEALMLTLARIHGAVTLPDLYDVVLALQADGEAWSDFAFEMERSGLAVCEAAAAEIRAARSDTSGGFKGILGEMMQALSAISDLRDRHALIDMALRQSVNVFEIAEIVRRIECVSDHGNSYV